MDSEREKFRTYVEKSGVISALTDVLVHLYEEPQRPPDALQYIKTSLGVHHESVVRCSMLEEKVRGFALLCLPLVRYYRNNSVI